MKNAYAISSLSRQMVKVCEQIDSLAMGVQDTEQGNVDVADAYTDMLLDEIEHVQMLTLKLTEVITEAAGEDEPANADEAGKARELGLSYAKYRAYLELQALGSAVTPDELQSMTMREIWDLIDSLSEPGSEEDSEGQSGRGGHGTGRGFGQGQRKGYGANRE